MTLETTPDNCFLVDQSKPVREVAINFYRWLVDRTPLTGRAFDPGESYRCALIHPHLEQWFYRGEVEARIAYDDTYRELQRLIPMVRDHTLPQDVIQVLEHITIKEIEKDERHT